jgi:Vitamin K epoxide reductase family
MRGENPTTWSRRIALAALALLGLCVAGYLTLFQLGVLSSVWDPFFRSREVLGFVDFPDAALGVLAYGTEIVLSFIGGRERWHTMPWTVLAFGFVILSGALVSVLLIIVQPLVVGAWCTLCLASAAISLAIFGWGADEPLAALQHLKRARASGDSIWRALWGLDA